MSLNAAAEALLGDGKYSTKSFVGEACNPEKIKSSLDQSDPMVKQHEDAVKSCYEKVKSADSSCQPGTNPNAQNAQQQASNYANKTNQQTAASSAAGTGGGGQSNGCGGLGDLMKNMQGPTNQYGRDCNGGREQCKSLCEEKAQESKSSCDKVTDQAKKQACEKNAEMVKSCTSQTAQACQKYEMQAQAIIAALANFAMQMAQMLKCQEDQGQDCTKNPNDPQCLKDDSIDCSQNTIAAQKDQECICKANPRAPGCPQADSAGLSEIAKKASSTSGGTSLNDSTSGLDRDSLAASRRSAKGAGPGLGGPGGGLPAGARAASDSPAATGMAGKAAMSEVLAGDYGGQGGRAAIGGGYPDVPPGVGRALQNANMRRDPANVDRPTGSFGRSNWQKVKERFVENRPTLLPGGI